MISGLFSDVLRTRFSWGKIQPIKLTFSPPTQPNNLFFHLPEGKKTGEKIRQKREESSDEIRVLFLAPKMSEKSSPFAGKTAA